MTDFDTPGPRDADASKNDFLSGNFENGKVSKSKYPQICVKMRFQIPNITKFYGGVSDTNTNSSKYTLETPKSPNTNFYGYLAHQIVKPCH